MKINFIVLITSILMINTVFSQESIEIGKDTELKKSENRIIVRNVSGNMFIINGKGGNIGFYVGEKEILMVDSQYANATEKILEKIKDISDKPIRYLINTHHHGDHTGGNKNMAENGTTIIAHDNVRENLQNVKSEEVRASVPVITFSEKMTINFESEEISAFHINNAHTNGDVVIYFPQSDVVHTGDAFVNKTYPFIDTDNGGSLEGYIEGLSRIKMLGNKNTKVIPGHGPVGNMRDVDYTQRMLKNLVNRVEIEINRGQTEEEIAANEDITSFYDDQGYGNGFIDSEKIRRSLYTLLIDAQKEEEKAKDKMQEPKEKAKEKMQKTKERAKEN